MDYITLSTNSNNNDDKIVEAFVSLMGNGSVERIVQYGEEKIIKIVKNNDLQDIGLFCNNLDQTGKITFFYVESWDVWTYKPNGPFLEHLEDNDVLIHEFDVCYADNNIQ